MLAIGVDSIASPELGGLISESIGIHVIRNMQKGRNRKLQPRLVVIKRLCLRRFKYRASTESSCV